MHTGCVPTHSHAHTRTRSHMLSQTHCARSHKAAFGRTRVTTLDVACRLCKAVGGQTYHLRLYHTHSRTPRPGPYPTLRHTAHTRTDTPHSCRAHALCTLPDKPPLRILEGAEGQERSEGSHVEPQTRSPQEEPPPRRHGLFAWGCVGWASPAIIRGGVGRGTDPKVLRPRGQPGVSRRTVHSPPTAPALPSPAQPSSCQSQRSQLERTPQFISSDHHPTPDHLHHQMSPEGKAPEKVRAYQSRTAS